MDDAAGALVSAAERDAALARLRPWLADNLVENPRAGRPDRKGEPEKRLALREPRKITWAFIAWDLSLIHISGRAARWTRRPTPCC